MTGVRNQSITLKTYKEHSDQVQENPLGQPQKRRNIKRRHKVSVANRLHPIQMGLFIQDMQSSTNLSSDFYCQMHIVLFLLINLKMTGTRIVLQPTTRILQSSCIPIHHHLFPSQVDFQEKASCPLLHKCQNSPFNLRKKMSMAVKYMLEKIRDWQCQLFPKKFILLSSSHGWKNAA